MKKETHIDALYDGSITTTEVTCTKCNSSVGVAMDGMDAAERFYNQGWRSVKGQPVCPKCKASPNS